MKLELAFSEIIGLKFRALSLGARSKRPRGRSRLYFSPLLRVPRSIHRLHVRDTGDAFAH